MTDSILTQLEQNNNKLEKLDKRVYVEKTYWKKFCFYSEIDPVLF